MIHLSRGDRTAAEVGVLGGPVVPEDGDALDAEGFVGASGSVEKKICRAAIQTGAVVLTKHAKDRMAQEGLIMNDVLNTLRGGSLLHFDFEAGVYKQRLTTGRIDAVVVVTGPDSFVIVTAFRSAP